jgi:hypothetical protein
VLKKKDKDMPGESDLAEWGGGVEWGVLCPNPVCFHSSTHSSLW